MKADTENASKDLVYLLSVYNITAPFSPTTSENIIEIMLTDASNIATNTNVGHYNTTFPTFKHNAFLIQFKLIEEFIMVFTGVANFT